MGRARGLKSKLRSSARWHHSWYAAGRDDATVSGAVNVATLIASKGRQALLVTRHFLLLPFY